MVGGWVDGWMDGWMMDEELISTVDPKLMRPDYVDTTSVEIRL